MGNDSFQGLERFMSKMHQPGQPSHTIITDPEFFVFLWFHDANGTLIQCPYLANLPGKLKNRPDFSSVNKAFGAKDGIQGGTKDPTLPEYCLDLTPFV